MPAPGRLRSWQRTWVSYENLLYNWRRKYTADGDKTKYATLEEENRDLKRQLAETRI